MKIALIFFSLFVADKGLTAQQCQPLAPADRSQFERFVKEWYHMPASQSVTLTDSTTLNSGCYRKLIFRASVPAPPLVLYLTPDKTRLVSGVMDLAVDPAISQKKSRDDLAGRLVSGALLTTGPNSAPVKLVVFSDFECPYCKQFANILAALRPEERAQIEIVYRQFPLNIHVWASDAAQISTCVALQNQNAFWKLHDFFFENQQALSKETILSKSLDYLRRSEVVDPTKLSACVAEKRFQPILQQDETLALDLGIRGTPTVFINGRAIVVRSVDDLRSAIQSEAGPAQGSASVTAPVPAHTLR